MESSLDESVHSARNGNIETEPLVNGNNSTAEGSAPTTQSNGVGRISVGTILSNVNFVNNNGGSGGGTTRPKWLLMCLGLLSIAGVLMVRRGPLGLPIIGDDDLVLDIDGNVESASQHAEEFLLHGGPPVPLREGETIATIASRREQEETLAEQRDAPRLSGGAGAAARNDKHRTTSSSTSPALSRSTRAEPSSTTGMTSDNDEVPVIEDKSKLSLAAQGQVPAAEALVCRQSVINFVINATDAKDECDGLKRAFDKTCSSAKDKRESNNKQGSQAGGGGGGGRSETTIRERQQQRKMSAASTSKTNKSLPRRSRWAQEKLARDCREMMWVWSRRVSRIARALSLTQLWPGLRRIGGVGTPFAESLPFFFAEDAVAERTAWENARYLVEHDMVEAVHYKTMQKARASSRRGDKAENAQSDLINTPKRPAKNHDPVGKLHRNLEAQEEDSVSEDADGTSTTSSATSSATTGSTTSSTTTTTSDASSASENVNTTSTSGTQKAPPKPLPSLHLPTTSAHASGDMINGALLLHQGSEAVLGEISNKTTTATTTAITPEKAAAVEDAAASSKAISDATAAVSAMLSDPDAIEARTCCASILNVYHENCETDEEQELSDRRLLAVLFVMAFCGIVKSLIRHFRILWLPEAAGCILVGVLSGYALMFFPRDYQSLSFDGNWFLRILLPPIIFEAAISINKRSFHRHLIPIILYSTLGTVFATIVTAWVVHQGTSLFRAFCTPIPYVEALTFGALISSIDPIAVLSVLSNMGVTDTDTIYVLIFGESLLNDGVAIVLYHTLEHFLDENLVIDREALTEAFVHFLVVTIGSVLIGIGSGVMSTVYFWLFDGCQTPLVELLLFFCWALLPYYVADGVGWSGIVSVVSTGIVMDLYVVGQKKEDGSWMDDRASELPPMSHSKQTINKAPTFVGRDANILGRFHIFTPAGHLSTEARTHIGFVTEMIATTLETAIFAYLGLFLFSSRYHWNYFHAIIAIIACCASRAVMIPALTSVSNALTRVERMRATKQQRGLSSATASCVAAVTGSNRDGSGGGGVIIDKRMQISLWFAGLRGAMSFALVEHLPLYDAVSGVGTRLKPELKAMTSACILFTVFVLGGYTYYLMEHLGMAPSVNKATSSSGPAPASVSNLNTGATTQNYELAVIRKNMSDDVASDDGRGNDKSSGEHYLPAPTAAGVAVRRQRHNNT